MVLLGFVFSHHECNLWALPSSAQLSSWVSARAELTVYSLRPGASVVHFKAVNTDHRRGRRHPRPPASKQHKDGGSLRITHLTTQFFFFLMLLLKKKNLSYSSIVDVVLISAVQQRDSVISSVQWLSRVRLSSTPWTAARQASLSVTNSWSLLKLLSMESVMPSNHLILC